MAPSQQELDALHISLDKLQSQFSVASDIALVRKLREQGFKTSTHVFSKWRNGKWSDADTILVRALMNGCNTPSP